MTAPMAWPITFVACDETPDQYRNYVGRVVDAGNAPYLPGVGWEGTFMGAPGRFISQSEFEIRPVDMRDEATKLLDEADKLLSEEPKGGERVDRVAARLARAQWLILKAQSMRVRRMTS